MPINFKKGDWLLVRKSASDPWLLAEFVSWGELYKDTVVVKLFDSVDDMHAYDNWMALPPLPNAKWVLTADATEPIIYKDFDAACAEARRLIKCCGRSYAYIARLERHFIGEKVVVVKEDNDA